MKDRTYDRKGPLLSNAHVEETGVPSCTPHVVSSARPLHTHVDAPLITWPVPTVRAGERQLCSSGPSRRGDAGRENRRRDSRVKANGWPRLRDESNGVPSCRLVVFSSSPSPAIGKRTAKVPS